MRAVLRGTVAERICAEMERKGVTAAQAARDAGLSADVLSGYLGAQRELDFSELRPLCHALAINLMRLVGKNFEQANLSYRKSGLRDRRFVGKVEEAFLLVAEGLPHPKALPAPPLDQGSGRAWELIGSIAAAVESLRGQFDSVEDLYEQLRLPLLDLAAGEDGLDAFLLNTKQHALVCVNRNKPPARLHFSLLHEAAHYIFDREREVPIDYLSFANPYDSVIKENERPEYFADKFAQFFLIPFAEAESLWHKWPNVDNAARLVSVRRTSADVIAKAIYDVARCHAQGRTRGHIPSYKEILDVVRQTAGTLSDDTIHQFARDQGQRTREKIRQRCAQFSEQVWCEVTEALEI